MIRRARPLPVLVALAALAGCRATPPREVPVAGATGAPLLESIARYSRPISTDSPDAQRWFDQGLVWLFGFNHDEAVRSFTEAAAHDPDHPMPWWGIAFAHGMNINDPKMPRERWKLARHAADQALLRIQNGNDAEQALVRAVSARSTWPPPREQAKYDRRYAGAMREVHLRFPGDPDIACFYAESLMNLQPWNYWTKSGEPKGRIEEIIGVLQTAMARHPGHPGLDHLYIHAVEASSFPEAAVPAADRLKDAVPGSGHLVHMPSHIFVRVGRYAESSDLNERAADADRAYFKDAPAPGLYAMYYAHNIHFIAYSCMMEARAERAIEAARALESEIPEAALREYAPLIEGLTSTTFHALVRFGRWEEVLAEPGRPDFRLFTNAVRHSARGVALAALGRPSEARVEQRLFEEAAARVPAEWFVMQNKAHDILPIARAMLEGEILFREGRREEAFAALRKGIEAEDNLVYDEPPGWMLPVRHALGALLMADGRFKEAESVYREDLAIHRDNGWSLLGLTQALEAQGRAAEATRYAPLLAAAWRRSDANATSSCFCAPRASR